MTDQGAVQVMLEASPDEIYDIELIRQKGKWLVNSWVPKSSPLVPNGSSNNGAGQ